MNWSASMVSLMLAFMVLSWTIEGTPMAVFKPNCMKGRKYVEIDAFKETKEYLQTETETIDDYIVQAKNGYRSVGAFIKLGYDQKSNLPFCIGLQKKTIEDAISSYELKCRIFLEGVPVYPGGAITITLPEGHACVLLLFTLKDENSASPLHYTKPRMGTPDCDKSRSIRSGLIEEAKLLLNGEQMESIFYNMKTLGGFDWGGVHFELRLKPNVPFCYALQKPMLLQAIDVAVEACNKLPDEGTPRIYYPTVEIKVPAPGTGYPLGQEQQCLLQLSNSALNLKPKPGTQPKPKW